MIEEFKVSSPKDDERMIRLTQPEAGMFDMQYQRLVNELPLPEMQRQQAKAQIGKRGVLKSTIIQAKDTLIGDQVRAIYDNRNHPG